METLNQAIEAINIEISRRSSPVIWSILREKNFSAEDAATVMGVTEEEAAKLLTPSVKKTKAAAPTQEEKKKVGVSVTMQTPRKKRRKKTVAPASPATPSVAVTAKKKVRKKKVSAPNPDGTPRKRGRKPISIPKEELQEMLAQDGSTLETIAKHFKVSVTTIAKRIKKYGL